MTRIKSRVTRDVKVLLERRAEKHGHTFERQVAFELEGAMTKKKLEKAHCGKGEIFCVQNSNLESNF